MDILGNSAQISWFFQSPFAFIGLRKSLTPTCPIADLREDCGTRSATSCNNIRQVNGSSFPQCNAKFDCVYASGGEGERDI